MVLTEVERLQKKIALYEHSLDCLNVKLYYLQNSISKTEYDSNENRLNVIKVSHQIELQKGKLHYLYSEFNLAFQMLSEEDKINKRNLTVKTNNSKDPVAICMVVNSNYKEAIYCIENLIEKTKHPFKFYIYNFNPKAVDYFSFLISHVADCEIDNYISSTSKKTLGNIYNEFLDKVNEKYAVILPCNVLVNDNWLTDLKYEYESCENSGCVSIKENIADLKLSSVLTTNFDGEDGMKTVYFNSKNYFKEFAFFATEKAKQIGKFVEFGLNGMELAEWTFRYFAKGYSNFYLKYVNAIRLKSENDNLLRPDISKQTLTKFKELANNSLTIEKNGD